MKAYRIATKAIHAGKEAAYYLVILNTEQSMVQIRSFARKNLDEANDEYAQIENQMRDGDPKQAVLVSVGSIKALQSAYPNYFLDTQAFTRWISRVRGLVR